MRFNMSKKITKAVQKAVEVLSVQDKKFIDIEMVDVMAQAHSAGLKRNELIFQVANSTKKLIGKDCTKERWELIFADFENRLVNTKQIIPTTARNYRVEVVAILKADGIKKPLGTSKTAKHEQGKKEKQDALEKKLEHVSIENLKAELVQLSDKLDKDSKQRFKDIQSIVLKKAKAIQDEQDAKESQELKDFKSQYTDWFNGLLKTQEGRTELIALRLNKEVRAVVQKVLN